MTRRSRQAVLMDTAHVFASRSTCTRAQVGAVIAMAGRIIATGYNGAPSGLPHCDHTCNCSGRWPDKPYQVTAGITGDEPVFHAPECASQRPCETATHAETNAVAFAARFGVATNGADLYVTMAPCIGCARVVVNAGLSTVYYDTPYRDVTGVHLLRAAGVFVHQMG